jgi:hypothetical protein
MRRRKLRLALAGLAVVVAPRAVAAGASDSALTPYFRE